MVCDRNAKLVQQFPNIGKLCLSHFFQYMHHKVIRMQKSKIFFIQSQKRWITPKKGP